MLYRENGQFKSTYRADQQIFPILQDRRAFAALRVLVGVPAGRYAVVGLFVSGATVMLYEVVFTRVLGLVFGVSSYAFSMVLGVFLAGLGLGALAAHRIARVELPSTLRRARSPTSSSRSPRATRCSGSPPHRRQAPEGTAWSGGQHPAFGGGAPAAPGERPACRRYIKHGNTG